MVWAGVQTTTGDGRGVKTQISSGLIRSPAFAENWSSEVTGALLRTQQARRGLFLAADASVEPDLRWVALDITVLSPEWQLDDPGLHHVEPVEEPLDVLS